MYGKIFDSMYDGTLVEDWRALVTFQQMIVLCDQDGMLDMTPEAIARRTGIPLEHITAGVAILESPDPHSRTPDEDGCRIQRIDEHRPWGWIIVNHKKYKHIQDAATIRAQTRERVRKHREKKKQSVTECNGKALHVTDGNGRKRHTDKDADVDTDTKDKNLASLDSPPLHGGTTTKPFDVVQAWNGRPGAKQVRKLTGTRLKKLKTRLADPDWPWADAIAKLPIPNDAKFDWQPDIDWLIANDSNAYKLAEGSYDRTTGTPKGTFDFNAVPTK